VKFVPGTFLIPHICWDCRLSFKRVHRNIAGEILCPQCKKPARMMARKFQAPSRSNVKGWEVVKLLYQHGWRGYGWNVTRHMTLREAHDYLHQKHEREKMAQTKRVQEIQNKKWQMMRKWPRIHINK
jgi:hypothetical protein